MTKGKKKKPFEVTRMMYHDGQHYEAGWLMLTYARQLLETVGWRVGELDPHPDSPLYQDCTGHEHEMLPMAGSKATYCPGALFVVTTRGGKRRYMCRRCVSLVAMAVLAKDRDRISALWAQMLPELRDPKEDEDQKVGT